MNRIEIDHLTAAALSNLGEATAGLGYDFGGFYWEATRCPFSGLVTIAVEGDHWKGLVFASPALVAEYARQPVSVLVHRLIERAGALEAA